MELRYRPAICAVVVHVIFASCLSRPPGSTALLNNSTIANPTFLADRKGSYVFQLIVNNGLADSPPVTVAVISRVNTPPVALDSSVRNPWRSPCVPVQLRATDAENGPPGFVTNILTQPIHGFLFTATGSGEWGFAGPPGSGTGASSLCYIPFSSTFTGFDTFTYTIMDSGFPAGCGVASSTCSEPRFGRPATVSIEIFEVR